MGDRKVEKLKILVVHGPNLNLLGSREPEIYGSMTLAEIDRTIEKAAEELGFELEIHQSAREGEIIEFLHSGVDRVAGAILNPAAYSHTSRAIAEAVRSVSFPVVEVHLSNIHAREPWRSKSVTAEAARGVIAGFGVQSYVAALHVLREMID